MQNLDFAHRIGVSNLCLRGLSPSAAIDQTLEAGFAALEFTPISYGGPEAFSPAERRELRRQLSRFKVVTVHSSGMGGANICSADPARREHARRRYLELVGFARDVEADVLTVHPGGMDPEGPTKEEVFAQNVEFGKEMAHAAGTAAMQLGYELFDARIGRQIGRKNFGVLFDIGHASRRAPAVDTTAVLAMIDELSDQTVQYHVHGVGEAEKKVDHLPFASNTWLDYERLVPHILASGFRGPLILEIGIRTENWAANLQDCVVARQDLVQLAK